MLVGVLLWAGLFGAGAEMEEAPDMGASDTLICGWGSEVAATSAIEAGVTRPTREPTVAAAALAHLMAFGDNEVGRTVGVGLALSLIEAQHAGVTQGLDHFGPAGLPGLEAVTDDEEFRERDHARYNRGTGGYVPHRYAIPSEGGLGLTMPQSP